MTVNDIVALFKADQDIQVRHEGEKAFISLFVKQYPYHDDSMDFIELDFSKKTMSFFEQYRIRFQNIIEKSFKGKDEHERLSKCYSRIFKATPHISRKILKPKKNTRKSSRV